MSWGAGTLRVVLSVRSWHQAECPAWSAQMPLEECACPPGQFLNPANRPLRRWLRKLLRRATATHS